MISFDQFAFAINDRRDCRIIDATNRVRKQQFAILMNFYEIIILFFHFANSTRSTSKRFFNDVINIANNDVASKRRRERSLESKDD